VQGVAGGGGDQVVDEVGGENEADALAAETGEMSDGVGEVSFSDAARAEEDDVGLGLGERKDRDVCARGRARQVSVRKPHRISPDRAE
jgi:hypothetical protein